MEAIVDSGTNIQFNWEIHTGSGDVEDDVEDDVINMDGEKLGEVIFSVGEASILVTAMNSVSRSVQNIEEITVGAYTTGGRQTITCTFISKLPLSKIGCG